MASLAGSSLSFKARPQAIISPSSFTRNDVRSSVSFWKSSARRMPALRAVCAAKPETIEKVCKIVREQLSVDDTKPVIGETKFSELGADSLDTVEIVMALEEEFGVSVPEDNAEVIETIEDAAKLIESLPKN